MATLNMQWDKELEIAELQDKLNNCQEKLEHGKNN